MGVSLVVSQNRQRTSRDLGATGSSRGGRRRALALRTRRPLLVALAFLLGTAGCFSRESLGLSAMSLVSSGVLNDPANKSLRFDLLKFGLGQLCEQMLASGAPLKLGDNQPVVGRFFADGCDSRIIDEAGRQSIVVRFNGRGFAWTEVTGRLGFASGGVVEYAADFQRDKGRLYIYFRPRSVGSVGFQPLMVESALARLGMGLAGVDAAAVGRDIVSQQLQRGFTVIRYSKRGETEFSAGLVPKGSRPIRPFDTKASDYRTLDNDRALVPAGQQDLIGFGLDERQQKLRITLRVEGAAAVDLALLRAEQARPLVGRYLTQPGPVSLLSAPIVDATALGGQPFSMELSLPRGTYTLLLDHSPSVGRNRPNSTAGARVDYLLQAD